MTDTTTLEALYRAVLDVRPGASLEELHRAYIARVKTAHPDHFQLNPALREIAEAWMRQINEAYEYLRKLGNRPPSADQREDAARRNGDREDRSNEKGRTAPAAETRPPTKSRPHWSVGLVAAFGCYGAIRIAAVIAVWSFPVVVAAAWAYTLIRGLRNKLVVYASVKDVVLSLLAGTAMLVGQLTGDICASLVGLLLCVASAIWSIRRNGSIMIGLAVCLFKVTFAPCWLALMLAPWFLPRSEGQQGAHKIRSAVFCGLMTLLMWKLVNRRH